jgi:hypothetical protein
MLLDVGRWSNVYVGILFHLLVCYVVSRCLQYGGECQLPVGTVKIFFIGSMATASARSIGKTSEPLMDVYIYGYDECR